MTNVASMSEYRRLVKQGAMEKWAKTFVDIYIKDGEEAAGTWALDTIPEEFHDEMALPIRAAFEEKGWTFDEDGTAA